MQGVLSKKAVLEEKKEEIVLEEVVPILEKDSSPDEEVPDILVSDDPGLEDEIIEESTKKAEPKGNFNFLNLDEVEAFKDLAFPSSAALSELKTYAWASTSPTL